MRIVDKHPNIVRRAKRRLRMTRNLRLGVFGLFLVLATLTPILYTRVGTGTRVYAAANNDLNFQARLLTSSGSIVSDGNYSVVFNLYNVSSGGSTQWTETQGSVTVRSGYLSVHLGSVTPLPGTIDWSQEQWLTMNVNGDGEMSPRLKLAAVPIAFRAVQADGITNGAGVLSASGIAQLAPGTPQVINSALAALRLNQTGAGLLAQFQGDSGDVFTIAKTGTVTSSGSATFSGGTLNLGTATQAGGIILYDGSTNTATIQSASLGQNTVYTLPDPGSGTASICLSTGNCIGTGDISQGGNSFTGVITIGTNDNYGLTLETNNLPRLKITNTGEVGIGTSGAPSQLLSVGGTTGNLTVDSSGNLVTVGIIQYASGTANTDSLICRNGSGQLAACSNAVLTGTAFIQNGNSFGGTAILGTNDSNSLSFETNNTTRWVIDANGHLVPNTNDTYDIGSDTARVRDLYLGGDTLHIGTSTTDEGTLSYNTVTDSLIVKNATNSTSALQVQTSTSTDVLTVDTTNSITILRGINSTATLGSEKVTNGDFTGSATGWTLGTGWAYDTDNVTKTAGVSSDLEQDVSAVNGETYQVIFTIDGWTTGCLMAQVGDTSTGSQVCANSTNETAVITVTGTGNLILSASSNFDGTIDDVSVKKITATNSVLTVNNGDGTTGLELRSGGSGLSNSFIGLQAGSSNTAGSENTGLGAYSLGHNTTGTSNTALGAYTLNNNTTGSSNTALGYVALYANTSGYQNSALGNFALGTNTTGSNNTALGNYALFNNGAGSNNTAIGNNALSTNATGSNNTAIGNSAGSIDPTVPGFATLNNLTNSTALGYGAQVQTSNSLILGGQGANAVKVGIGTTIPLNTLSVSPTQYDTGTISQTASTAVVGLGTTFTAAMVGSELIYADGTQDVITGFIDATNVTVNTSRTHSSSAYRIHYIGLQVTSGGNVGIGDSTPAAAFTVGSGGLFRVNSSGAVTAVTGITFSSGSLNLANGGITNTGSITGVGTNITASSGLTIASGGAGDLTFDSASNKIIFNDTTFQRTAAGTTTFDLVDGLDTTFAFTNSGAGNVNLTTDGTVTAGNGLTISANGANITGSLNLNTGGITNTGSIAGATTIDASGLVTSVGLTAGSGLVQGTGGLTITGTTNLNATGAGATNLGTGTGNVSIGNTTGTLAIASSGGLNVTTGGAVTGVSTLGTSGIITVGAVGTASNDTVICRNGTNQLASCNSTFATTANAFLQNGNSFSGLAVLGTNDANSLAFRTNTTNKLILDTSGNLAFQQASTISAIDGVATGNGLTFQAGSSTSGSSNGGAISLIAGNGTGFTTGGLVSITAGNAPLIGGNVNILGGNATGAAFPGGVSINAGTGTASSKGTINVGNTNAGAINIGNATDNTPIVFNNGTGTFGTGTGLISLNGSTTVATGKTLSVLGATTVSPTVNGEIGLTVNGTSGTAATAVSIAQTGNAANLVMTNTARTSGALLSLTHSTSALTGTGLLFNFASGSGSFVSGSFADFQINSVSRFRVDSTGALVINSNSSSALRITSTAGIAYLNVDVAGNQVTIGNADATGVLLVLDSKSGATDPTGVAGGMYYNTTNGVYRCFNGGWATCGAPDTSLFEDITAAAFAGDNQTTQIFNDATKPNIVTDSTTSTVLINVHVSGLSNTANDAFFAVRVVFTTNGVDPSCTTSTQAGRSMISGFTTATTHPYQMSGSFVHNPGVAGTIKYTVCSSDDASGTTLTDTPDNVTISLVELES